MNDIAFITALKVRIEDFVISSGNYPKAILAGGEAFYILQADQESVILRDGPLLMWRNIPVIRTNEPQSIYLVQAMTQYRLPPKGE